MSKSYLTLDELMEFYPCRDGLIRAERSQLLETHIHFEDLDRKSVV